MPGRKPKTETNKKTVQRSVAMTPDDAALAKKLAADLNCSEGEIYRRGLHLVAAQAQDEAQPLMLRLSGDADTVERKGRALEAFRHCATAEVAADRAGITTRTLRYWAENDPVFNELGSEAQAISVGRIRSKLYDSAMNGNMTAQFGILNAFDPMFGQVRQAMIERIMEPFVTAIVEASRRFMSKDDLPRFAREVNKAHTAATSFCVRPQKGHQ